MPRDLSVVLSVMQQSLASTAAAKLARALTAEELAGIASLRSMMMLEAIERSFAHDSTSAASVEETLAGFAAPRNASS